jgi:hypothetical protein
MLLAWHLFLRFVSIVQKDVEQRAVHFQCAVVMNESHFAEVIP